LLFSEIIIVLSLILLNGLFSMAEMAVISAKKNRLEMKAEDGDKAAQQALELAQEPNRFLSMVQIGITLIGILSGALGGATIAAELSAVLAKVPYLARYSNGLGVGIVVVLITFLSLVLGELVPKRIALNNAEKVAIALSPLMRFISKISTPLVNLLSGTTTLVLRTLGIKLSDQPAVTEEDLKNMLYEGSEIGVIEKSEQNMVERIFRLSDRNVSAVMTPYTEIIFLNADSSYDEIYQKITSFPFSRFPVYRGIIDNVIGIVHSRDLLLQCAEDKQLNLEVGMQKPLFIPETTPALDVVEILRRTGIEIAVVIDEYGGVVGLAGMSDILEAIIGNVLKENENYEDEIIQREDGSWLLDGIVQVDEMKDHLDLDDLPGEEIGRYETVGGFMMAQLGRIPKSGDFFEWENMRFEVVDMDGRRVDKVLVSITKEKGAE
jgi:putative hemolysin